MVLVPERRRPGQEDIIVTDPKPADKPQQWKMTQTISVAALVYGPAGLNRKKVVKFLSQDEVLVAQLADYADKTAQAEQFVATLSNSESSSASVNAALNGFASQYGFAVQIDRNAPRRLRPQTVFAAMNPQLADYNPLASSTAQNGPDKRPAWPPWRARFSSAAPLDWPPAERPCCSICGPSHFPIRSSAHLSRSRSTGSGVNLCGQQGPSPPHTRVAYLWASRIPNVAAPSIRIGDANFIPATQKTPLPVDVPDAGWKYLDRVRDWALVSGSEEDAGPGCEARESEGAGTRSDESETAAGRL